MDSPLFAVAPMLDWTDRDCRVWHRLLCPKAIVYTEMVVAEAICRSQNPDRLLACSVREAPVVLQLGGNIPHLLAMAVRKAEEYPYAEYNLNVGCPSHKVQEGRFGACLMKEPHTVAACLRAMQKETHKPITVKTRLGIDEHTSDAFLYAFIDTVAAAGCTHFIVHARQAWLQGLNPKQNREVPPLQYERVYALKERYRDITITLNGGIRTLQDVQQPLERVEGVMVGRKAYEHPWWLTEISSAIFQCPVPYSRQTAALSYAAYLEEREQNDPHPPQATALHPLQGLFHGLTGARQWRQLLSEYPRPMPPSAVVRYALEALLCPK
jgi:tRNA-dihydrouridine synthase A